MWTDILGISFPKKDKKKELKLDFIFSSIIYFYTDPFPIAVIPLDNVWSVFVFDSFVRFVNLIGYLSRTLQLVSFPLFCTLTRNYHQIKDKTWTVLSMLHG